MITDAESVWHLTRELDYMDSDGRGAHPSHGVVTERLRQLHGDQAFSLLDAGVFSGVTYQRLAEAGLSVDYTGIDISEPILEACRQRFPQARWVRMSAMDLSFPDRSFDVVNARHLLEVLPYYETAVRELFRVARKTVVLCLFITPRAPERLMRRVTADDGGYIWFNRCAPGPLEELLHKLSSEVESLDVLDDTPGARRPNRIYLCTKKGA